MCVCVCVCVQHPFSHGGNILPLRVGRWQHSMARATVTLVAPCCAFLFVPSLPSDSRVMEWLGTVGVVAMEQISANMRTEGIDMEAMLGLKKEDLQELGFNMGARSKILQGLEARRKLGPD
jgi:hypothetical protein